MGTLVQLLMVLARFVSSVLWARGFATGSRRGVFEGLRSPARSELTLVLVLPLQCLLAWSSCPHSLPLMQGGPLLTPLLFLCPQPPLFLLSSFLHLHPIPGLLLNVLVLRAAPSLALGTRTHSHAHPFSFTLKSLSLQSQPCSLPSFCTALG